MLRQLKAENDKLTQERDRLAGRVVALEVQCVELGHAVKAHRDSLILLTVDGERRAVKVDDLVDAYVSMEKTRKTMQDLAASAATLKPPLPRPAEFAVGAVAGEPGCRPCVTVAGEDDQGVFMVTVPQARSVAIDF